MPRPPVDWKNGVIYLIHFDRPYMHAQHYLGLASDFDKRMERHKKGTGSNLIKVIQDAGIGWEVVRKWDVGEAAPQVEKELKKYKNNRRLCPICMGQYAYEKAEHLRAVREQKRKERNSK